MTGFGTGDQSRWWLTGLEWDWFGRSKDANGKQVRKGKRFKGNERQEILDTVNRVVLPASEDPAAVAHRGAAAHSSSIPLADNDIKPAKVDAPLVRLVNFIRTYHTQSNS